MELKLKNIYVLLTLLVFKFTIRYSSKNFLLGFLSLFLQHLLTKGNFIRKILKSKTK